MKLNVYFSYIFTEKQVQIIYNTIQRSNIEMEPMDILLNIYDALKEDGDNIKQMPVFKNLQPHILGICYMLGLPQLKTVRDVYKFYLRSLERVK